MDTTLLLDDPLSSSPDPLADEIPSSVQSKTRRIAMPHHDYSMAAARSSSPAKSPTRSMATRRSMSPRKQTFELDVGNEATPQRILVTVEADETMHSGISRRLFPPSSPTRKVVRAEETTTRKVPLRGLSDDEGFGEENDAATPKKRGRPRKSNGTPVPKSRKRAGTPLKPTNEATRPRLDPPSEASMFSDMILGDDTDIRGSTPKPRPRARKTPAKRAPTPSAAPSSQIPPSKQGTGKKRGRPRKALMPEEVAEIAVAESELGQPEMADEDIATSVVDDVLVAGGVRSSIEEVDNTVLERQASDELQDGIAMDDADSVQLDEDKMPDGIAIDDDLDDPPPPFGSGRDDSVTPVPPELTILEPVFEDLIATNRPPSEERKPEATQQQDKDIRRAGFPMRNAYVPMEPQDDGVSDVGTVDSGNMARQDDLTHASDFSMIAVESLPSFQASFQASFHGNLSRISEVHDEPAELGEATNMMINQTLETLRRSIQNEFSADNSDAESGADGDEMRTSRRASTADLSAEKQPPNSQSRNRTAWSSSPLGSPKRRRSVPLSRQVFAGKNKQAEVDDSFSSIADSILQAATPARFKATRQAESNQQSTMEEYEDDFSEIPEAVLEAATPAAARQRPREFPSGLQSSPINRDGSPDIASGLVRQPNRLPTPDDTSSSNTEVRRTTQDEESQGPQRSTEENSRFKAQVPSSPPNIVVQRFESMEPRPEPQRRDPQREIPESPQILSFSEPDQGRPSRNLEPPPSARRPTLSPIVRVARTLQSVMSDKSSPEGLESNLGSPFRGSHSRQSSITKSPIRNAAELFGRGSTNQMPSMGSAPSRDFRASITQSRRSGSQHDRTQSLDDLFGPQINATRQDRASQPQSTLSKERTPERRRSVQTVPVSSSTKALLPSDADDPMSWAADESPLRARSLSRQSITQALRESSRAATQRRSSNEQAQPQPPPDLSRMSNPSLQQATHPEIDDADDILLNDADDLLLDEAEDDLWDIEATRPDSREGSPPFEEANPHRMSDEPRRGKMPSPWRRSANHSNYQDDMDSPSQILLDDSPRKGRPAVSVAHDDEAAGAGAFEHASDDEEDLPSPPRAKSLERPDDIGRQAVGSDYSLLRDQSDAANLPSEKSVESVNVEEYSLIAPQTQRIGNSRNRAQPITTQQVEAPAKDNAGRPGQPPAKSRLFGGFDIMSFFSSPSALPNGNDAQTARSKEQTAKSNGQPSVPYPELPKPQPQAKKAQPTQPAQPALWAAGLFPSIAQKEFRPSPERGNTLFTSSAPASSAPAEAETSPTPTPRSREPPSTPPERQAYPLIEQKRDFTPRSGQNGSALFTGARPNRAEVSRANTQPPVPTLLVPSRSRQDPDTSVATEDSEYERVPPRKVPSRWDKRLSPSKSSFRSPMKPTTPGRVVAFTKNVVFPNAPADQQPPNRLIPAMASHNNTSKHVFLQPPPQLLQPRHQAGQENELRTKSAANTAAAARLQSPERVAHLSIARDKTTAPVRTSATQSNHFPQPKAFALTGTAWTKAHWVRFDEILQLRRKNVQQFRQDHPEATLPGQGVDDPVNCDDESDDEEQTRSRSASYHSTILGKQVSGQGESMLIEAWHLEVIRAFAQEIGPSPWDEMVLAKRLFALIIGEERRRHGIVRSSTSRYTTNGVRGQRVNLGPRHRV